MLCYVMLCYVMLCYVMLCYVMLCYVMLCYFMLCYIILVIAPLYTDGKMTFSMHTARNVVKTWRCCPYIASLYKTCVCYRLPQPYPFPCPITCPQWQIMCATVHVIYCLKFTHVYRLALKWKILVAQGEQIGCSLNCKIERERERETGRKFYKLWCRRKSKSTSDCWMIFFFLFSSSWYVTAMLQYVLCAHANGQTHITWACFIRNAALKWVPAWNRKYYFHPFMFYCCISFIRNRKKDKNGRFTTKKQYLPFML